MQTLLISDQAAEQLNLMAAKEHISSRDLIERLIVKHRQEMEARATEQERQQSLKAFFAPYRKDLGGFKFDRDEANPR
jgi:predicted CopG family antitoxin